MGKVCTRAKWSIQPEQLPLDEMPLHRALHRHKHKRGAIRRLRPPLSREGRRSYIVNNWLSIHRTIIKSWSWRLQKKITRPMSLWYTSADSESKPHLLHVKYTWYSPPQLKNLFLRCWNFQWSQFRHSRFHKATKKFKYTNFYLATHVTLIRVFLKVTYCASWEQTQSR